MEKYLEALERGSVKDFQGMLKKIDDEAERKEVIAYINSRYGGKSKDLKKNKNGE